MLSLSRQKIFYVLFLLSWSILAQTELSKTNTTFSPKDKKEIEETQQIKNLYLLYNNGGEQTAYKKAHQLLKKAELTKTKASSNLLLAYYFNKQSALDSSLLYTKKALQYNKSINDSLKNRLNSLGYNLMAAIYSRKGLLSESKKYRIKGIETAQKYNEQNLYFTHKHGLALLYSREGNYTKALELFKECLNYKKDPEMIYGSYINIGDIYSHQKNYALSTEYYQKAVVLCENKNNINCSAIVSISIGDNYLAQKQINNALAQYQKAFESANANNYPQPALKARINIAQIYFELKQYHDANLLLTEALITAKELGVLQEQMLIYEQLKTIALAQNNFKNAYRFATKRSEIKDSIAELQNKKDINELEIKFNTLQKEKEIKTLQFENETSQLKLQNQNEAIENLFLQREISKKKNENSLLFFQNFTQKKQSEIALLKKQKQLTTLEIEQEKQTRNIVIVAFSLLILPILGLLFQYYKRLKTQRLLNNKQKEISTQKLTAILKEQELKLIKASVEGQDRERQRISQELHDSIGGNLAAIKVQMHAIDGYQTSHLIQKISSQLDETYDQVRNLSHNLIPKKFSQNQFCIVLEDYVTSISDVTELKIETNFYPKQAIDELPENLQLEIFKIIQELLTNTIKHAKATKIDLQINLFENNLNLLFEDNGIGFSTLENPKGIGLINLENRLHKIFGSLEIDTKLKRGTIFNIEIPLLKTNKKTTVTRTK